MTERMPTPVLDHAVMNVADGLDEARARYRRLGFQLTPRGHHSLGSSNHLAVFGENYLELLGYEAGRGDQRQDIWQAPRGLTGLVWKTADADATFRHLQQRDIAGEAPAAFFRPVTLPDGCVSEARFRTVRLRPSLIPNGRSFFCQHLTPQAVWQPAWQRHPNGVVNISEFTLVAQDPDAAAGVYRQLFGARRVLAAEEGTFILPAGAARVRFAPVEWAQRRFGALPQDDNGLARMVALSFRTDAIAKVDASLAAGDIPCEKAGETRVVSAEQGGRLALLFHP